jgi:hypothetical protein
MNPRLCKLIIIACSIVSYSVTAQVLFSESKAAPRSILVANQICMEEFGLGLAESGHLAELIQNGGDVINENYMFRSEISQLFKDAQPFDRAFSVKATASARGRIFLLGRSEKFWYPSGNPLVRVACARSFYAGTPARVSMGLAPVNSRSRQSDVCQSEFGTYPQSAVGLLRHLMANGGAQLLRPFILHSHPLVAPNGRVFDHQLGAMQSNKSVRYDVIIIDEDGNAKFPENNLALFPVLCG